MKRLALSCSANWIISFVNNLISESQRTSFEKVIQQINVVMITERTQNLKEVPNTQN